MKWNDTGNIAGAATLLVAALGVGQVRPWLAERYHGLGHLDDVYALPTPEQTIVLSLGYRSALADLVYANTLVGYGIHSQENRRFEFAGNYLDTAIALDPTLREVYYFADTILTLQPRRPPYKDYVKAKEIMLRGLEQFPFDTELWLVTGQYMTYLAPGAVEDPELQEQWRREGSRVLAHACDLAADDRIVTKKCIGAARELTEAGEREAVIRFLERVLALSDDERTRANAEAWLRQKLGESVRAELTTRRERLVELRQDDLPFVSQELFILLGPPFDPSECTGQPESARCATRWATWLDSMDTESVDTK